MVKMRDTFLSNKGKRILFVIFAFFLLYLVSYVIDPYSYYWRDYLLRSPLVIIGEWVVSFLFCLLISESSIFINTTLNKYLPWTESARQRLIIETGLNLTSTLVILMLNLLFFCLLNEDPLPIMHTKLSIDETRGLIQWIIVSVIIAFMIIGINTANYFIVNWRNMAIKAAEHQQLAVEAELQSLKLQIDPHFVFNNLSVLSELILEDQQLGYEYAENFSKVYRYLLINSKKDIISLAEELKFLSSYIFLIKQRIGAGVNFDIDVQEESKYYYLPPFSLQLLVENALKHNKTLKNAPLVIRIYNSGPTGLVVDNQLVPMEKQVSSSGLGLKNIVSRYELLKKPVPEIIVTDTMFTVKIQLIRLG